MDQLTGKYVWKSDDVSTSHSSFKRNQVSKNGKFVEAQYKGRNGILIRPYDNLGYLKNRGLQISAAKSRQAFFFNRPEDIHTNPKNGNEAIFATTGYKTFSNKIGAIYTVNVNFTDLNNISASVKIIYDSNVTSEQRIRNPDNLVWSGDGNIYVSEDHANADFIEPNSPSIWKLSLNGSATRIAKVAYNIPKDQTYNDDYWETSGIIDISKYYTSSTWLLVNVQAHGVTVGRINTHDLVKGGQMVLLRKP